MEPIVEIIRLEGDPLFGTMGILRLQKHIFCATLEPPDRLNEPNKSSIPAQQYRAARVTSPKFGKTFEVIDVPGRSNILFHPGNTVDDTAGCIILGRFHGNLNTFNRGILNSGETFRQFLSMLSDTDSFHLTIKEEY